MTVDVSGRLVVFFDTDVLIYAAAPGHPMRSPLHALLDDPGRYALSGSTLLLAEALIKPTRDGDTDQLQRLKDYLGHLELWPATETVVQLGVWLGATYGLDAMDAVHLATAVDGGGDVFLTNNRKDFDAKRIAEIDVVYPDQLPAGPSSRR